jgi:hypothetical protein
MSVKTSSRIKVLPGIAAAFGATLVLLACNPASADPDHRGLTGSWLVTVQQYDCATAAILGLPFQSFLTFGADRTLIETTDNAAFAPGQRGPGHGFWDRINHDSFRAVSEAFILFTTPAHGSVPEFDAGQQRIDQHIDYDGGERFTSDATVTFTDAAGKILRSGCARASAVRMNG